MPASDFKSAHARKVASFTRQVERFVASLESLPQSPSGDNLLRLAAFIGARVHSRENTARSFANYASSLRDRELLDLEIRRGEALSRAISKVMPRVGLPPSEAALAFRSHLIGSIKVWLELEDDDARRYLIARTKEWLTLAGVSFSEQLAGELAATRSD